MGLLDGLEKLITEHGSAAILKERIALANDKYSALETKVKELNEENARLRAEVAELRVRQPAQQAARAQANIDELSERVLVLLSKQPDITLNHIARQLNIGEELAALHVEDLEASGLVYGSHSMMQASTYSLDQEGRRLLARKGLLK